MTAESAPQPWPALAACRGRTDLFFATDRLSERIAVAVCIRCQVRPQCLQAALEEESRTDGSRHGVRGALRPSERAQLATSGRSTAELAPNQVVSSGRVVQPHRLYAAAL